MTELQEMPIPIPSTLHCPYPTRWLLPPCLYALNRRKETTFQLFVLALQEITCACNPVKIVTDFEKSAINTFTKRFPSSALNGCYFHLRQNFNRKIKELGLENVNENKLDFALSLKMMPALAFILKIQILLLCHRFSRTCRRG